jgi:hypothetical protein
MDETLYELICPLWLKSRGPGAPEPIRVFLAGEGARSFAIFVPPSPAGSGLRGELQISPADAQGA